MLNELNIIGYLGHDPRVKNVNDDTKVASFSVAVSKKWKKDGEAFEKTEWFQVDAWGKTATLAEKLLKTGSKVHITGEISLHTWLDENQELQAAMKVRPTRLIALGRRSEKDEPPADAEDDIPF